ncbi:hypothetical protein ACFL3M_03580 [Patescibacteria group bacterium]
MEIRVFKYKKIGEMRWSIVLQVIGVDRMNRRIEEEYRYSSNLREVVEKVDSIRRRFLMLGDAFMTIDFYPHVRGKIDANGVFRFAELTLEDENDFWGEYEELIKGTGV